MRDSPQTLVSRITSLDFEIKVLQKYREIIEYFLMKAEMATNLEFDLELVKKSKHPAIIYRSEKKKILKNQLSISKFLVKVIQSKDYLQLMDFEKKLGEQNDEYLYQYRRFFMWSYLEQIFEFS